MANQQTDDSLKILKYASALLALSYLVAAFLPTLWEEGSDHYEMLIRTFYAAQFALFCVLFYGLHQRKMIYRKLTPILLGVWLAGSLALPLWSLVRLSLSWVPF